MFYFFPLHRGENRDTSKKFFLSGSHVLVTYLLLALAALESMVLEAWTCAGSHEPRVWLHLDKGSNRCEQSFIAALARAFWLWLLPVPRETTLAESFKTLLNHNRAPYSTKITSFKSVPT